MSYDDDSEELLEEKGFKVENEDGELEEPLLEEDLGIGDDDPDNRYH